MIKVEDKDREIERLKAELERLRESNAAWRRMAQEKGPKRKWIRHGYRNGNHYRVCVVHDIPGDLPIQDVLEELKKTFLPSVYPYQFEGIDWSNRYDGWLVQVYRPIKVDMWIVV